MVCAKKRKRALLAVCRANQRHVKWQGSAHHITLMAVVNAADQAYIPAVILPGEEPKYQGRPNGRIVTPADFLPRPNYLFMRPIAGMDRNCSLSGQELHQRDCPPRCDGQHLLQVYDVYGSHMTYRTLKVLQENNITVAALPAHSSHALQPLDNGVFGPLKDPFRNFLNRRTVTTTKDTKNDVFTIYELIALANSQAVTSVNISIGFCNR